MIKQIVRVIFSRNGIPKSLVPDNAPEFCDEYLNLWLEKIECKPYKTLPYHPQSNGLAERMVKMGLKACSQQKEKFFSTKTAFKLLHNTTCWKTWKLIIGRQIRAQLTMSYSTNEKVWYKKNKESNLKRAEFIIQKGYNTAIINKEKGNSILANADQIRPLGEYEEQNEEEISAISSIMIYWNNLYGMKHQKMK